MSEPKPAAASALARARAVLAALLPDLSYVPLAIVAAYSFVFIPGVPDTHDGIGIDKIESYRRAYLAWDLFPTWTALASNGHGSAWPILYHRLHPQVFGALALLTGTVPASKVAVVVIIALGAAGMRRLCVQHGARPWLAWLGGAFLLASNYVCVDWYVRGAIAELLAFMIAPWCIGAIIGVVDRRERGIALGLWVSFLFYAHMVVSVFFGFVALAVLIDHVWRTRARGLDGVRPIVRPLAVAGGIFACLVVPLALAVTYTTSLSPVGNYGMEPHKTYPFDWYFFDPNMTWFGQIKTDEISVEIGRYILIPLAALVVLSSAARAGVRTRAWRLVVPAVVFVLLQPRDCIFVFELLPAINKVQFPWRLLSYIVPIAILALAIATEWTLRAASPPWAGVAAAAAALVVAAQLVTTVNGQRDARKKTKSPQQFAPYMADIETTATWDGFIPGGGPRLRKTPFVVASDGCTFSSPELSGGAPVQSHAQTEYFTRLHLTVQGTGCRLKLNQYDSPLVELTSTRPVELRTEPDRTMLIDVPEDATTLTLRVRGIFELAAREVVQRLTVIPQPEAK